MLELSEKTCTACAAGTKPLSGQRLEDLAEEVPEWTLVDGAYISRTFKFPDFASALAFVNRVGALAEQENHHPLIRFTWGEVTIDLSTHKIKGLSDNDFILAAKIDELPRS